MANLQDKNSNSSGSNYYGRTSHESTKRSNTQASAYAVDANTMALTGFHFSTCGAGGPACGDAAHNITEECERLFCETLKAVFLVEKSTGLENSLVMDAHHSSTIQGVQIPQHRSTEMKHDLPTPSPSPDGRVYPKTSGMIREYVEIYDYTGGARFRGFVAEKDDERALFVFFDKEVIGKDLKPGLMALLELASSECFECSQLVVCVDRTADEEDVKDTTRNLGWVGFELMMLDEWCGDKGCLSDRWILMRMDT